jgi:hypothetical protein
MTDPAVISGTFADLKIVKTRSVVQIVIEVPIEQGKQIVEAFGFPQPGAEIPVAVARLDEQPVKAPKRYSRAQKAGILCNDPHFQKWIATQGPYSADEGGAKLGVYGLCKIQSRRELNQSLVAETAWDKLVMEFEATTERLAEGHDRTRPLGEL